MVNMIENALLCVVNMEFFNIVINSMYEKSDTSKNKRCLTMKFGTKWPNLKLSRKQISQFAAWSFRKW